MTAIRIASRRPFVFRGATALCRVDAGQQVPTENGLRGKRQRTSFSRREAPTRLRESRVLRHVLIPADPLFTFEALAPVLLRGLDLARRSAHGRAREVGVHVEAQFKTELV